MRRRLLLICFVLLLFVVAGVLVVHTPPVRSYALRLAVRAALSQGIQIEAARLDYNLATRRVRLAEVRVSAVGDAQPFFMANEVSAAASPRVFFGEIAFDEVSIGKGAVHIVRRADGTTNLPKSSGSGTGEPAPLPIARVNAPALTIDYRDESADVELRTPAMTVDLSSRGRLALEAPMSVRVGSTSTQIDTLASDAVFDGRDLQLSNLRVEAPELSAQIEGTLALIRQEPSIDFRVSGDSEVERVAKWWGQEDEAPRGGVHFEGTVSGPLDEPTANLNVSSNAISWQRLNVTNMTGRVRLEADSVEIDQSQAAIAGGQVNAAGSLMWEEPSNARVEASWRDVEAAQIVSVFSGARVTPSGRATGELTARGSLDSFAGWDVDARVALAGGQRGRGRIPVPGESRFRLSAGQWGLDARHVVGDVTAVDASLTGQLHGSDFADSAITGTLRASESDLQAIFRMLSEAGLVTVDQDLVTGSIRANANVEGTVRQPILQLVVESDEAAVAGQEIVNVRARGRLEGSAFDLEELVAAQPPSVGGEQATGQVRVAGRYDLDNQAYTATVNASSWRIDSTDDVPLSGVVNLDYSGQGRGRDVFGKARLVSNLTVSPDIALGEIVADVDLQGDHANIAARAPEFNAVAGGSVRLDAPYQASLRMNTQALDLARAVRGLELPVSIDGTADIGLEAEGPIQLWRVGRASLEVTALDGHVQTLPVALREPMRARYVDGRLLLDRLEGTLGKTLLSAAGALPIENASSARDAASAPVGDAILATLTGDLYDVAVAAAVAATATGSSSEAPIAAGKGPLVLLARITGSAESPSYAADLELGPGMVQARSDLAPVENLQVRAHLENGLLELRNLTGRYHGADVTATGQAPLALLTESAAAPGDGQAVLHATAVGVTSAVLAPFVDASTIGQIGGSLDVRLDLSSTSRKLDDLQGEVVLERLNLTVAELPVTQRSPTRVVANGGVARIESWAWESEGTSIEVSGQVGLANQQAAILANGQLDARLLTPFLGATGVSTAGQVDTRLSITGPVTEPTINGDVRLADGELRLREPRVVASDLDAVAVLARGNAFITSLSGTVNGGTLSGSGQVQYTPEVQGQFTANVTGMAMNFPEGLRTEVDSSLELTTTVKEGEPANRLSGLITIRRGAYREPLALMTGLLNNLQRTGTTTGSPPSPFLQGLALDVRVITDEDLVIDNNVADAQLGADLRVINVASAPALSGRAELREGGQLFLGRNTYVVESGTIDFANPSMIEPTLGIVATTRVSGNDVEVRISGTPNNLMTELTSDLIDPTSGEPLDQADLTALLLTGRRLSELNAAQAAEVGAQVLGTLGGDVLGFAGRAVGLDTLRVVAETNPRDPADLASEIDPTSRITFGKSIGSKLDVTLSQSLVQSSAQTWIVDYLPVRRLAFRFVSDDDDLRSYAFRHDVTFGTAPTAIRSGDASREARLPRVGSIRFMGNLVFPEPDVRRQLELNEKDRFDFIDWQEDRDRLERFYHGRQHLAARITAGREEAGEQVDLTYTVEAGPETHIRVSGVKLPRSVFDELETAWAQSVFEGFLIEEAEAIVRGELARQAAYQPMVDVTVEGAESVRTLVIDVTPSPRAERIEVRFEGVDERLRSYLLDRVGDRTHALQALTGPSEYQRTVLATLHAAGYPQASVTVGLPIFEETIAAIPVTVNPGPQFRIGMVRFEGAANIAIADLEVEAGLAPGAVYRAADVEAARTRLQSRYRREGFTTASLMAREDFRAEVGEVDVVFVVTQGPRQVIEEIAIFGTRSVDEDVVRRTLRLNVGDSLRTADWLEARRRLFESGLFRRVDISVEPLEGVAERAPVRLRVNVEEWPALRLRYGFQVAEERPEENVEGRDLVPGISGDLTRRTLFGRAITVGVAAQYQNLERLGRLFVSSPTLFSRQVQTSLTLERSREESRTATLVTDRTTAAWEQRGRWSRLTLSYGLRFERNRTFDTQPLDPTFPFDLTVHIGRLTSSAAWDSRDDPSDSTRGTFVSTSLEHSTSRLGSDLFFVRSLTQAYHFIPWKQVVLASAARYGAVQPLSGQLLTSSLRFFAGGGRTVRGVADDSLGGLDVLGNPLGGRGLLTLNQEMRFPVYGWLRGVVFIDAGNVFPLISDVRIQDLVGSTGVGLRLVTPFALFRIDYGRTIWNRPADDSGRVVFGIGQTF
jgi:outer membrane protein assembly factor BamA/autotransporter translocation and assembly factor TamB